MHLRELSYDKANLDGWSSLAILEFVKEYSPLRRFFDVFRCEEATSDHSVSRRNYVLEGPFERDALGIRGQGHPELLLSESILSVEVEAVLGLPGLSQLVRRLVRH